MIVSYSIQEPEWPSVCECKYDEVHDRMDREDCLLHSDIEEEPPFPVEDQIAIKKPATIAKRDKENAA
jgi:hypothetical protein